MIIKTTGDKIAFALLCFSICYLFGSIVGDIAASVIFGSPSVTRTSLSGEYPLDGPVRRYDGSDPNLAATTLPDLSSQSPRSEA